MCMQVCHTLRLLHNGKSLGLMDLQLSSLLVEPSRGLSVDPLIVLFFPCAFILKMEIFEDILLK